jgi:uncharacterized RDD family membrane protein YckC
MTPDPDMQPQFYDAIPTKRLLAWLVDTVIIAVLTLVAIPFTAFIGLFFLPFLFLILGFAYRVVTLSRSSATWGMQLMAIELRTSDDARFDPSIAFMHTLGYTISIAMFPAQLVSIILMLSTERRQGLSDLILGTVALNRRA